VNLYSALCPVSANITWPLFSSPCAVVGVAWLPRVACVMEEPRRPEAICYACTNNSKRRALCFGSSVRLWRDSSLLSGGISMRLATHIHHVSGNCSKAFQGQRSEVKVITRPVNLLWQIQTFRQWCRDSLVCCSYDSLLNELLVTLLLN